MAEIINQYQDGEYTVTEYASGRVERRLPASTPQATPIKRLLTRLAFRNRFTPAEKVALYTAAESSVQIKIYLDDLAAATFVDPERADTIAGVQALEAATIIGPGRAAEILGAPITDEEVYVG